MSRRRIGWPLRIPDNVIAVSESGLKSRAELDRLAAARLSRVSDRRTLHDGSRSGGGDSRINGVGGHFSRTVADSSRNCPLKMTSDPIVRESLRHHARHRRAARRRAGRDRARLRVLAEEPAGGERRARRRDHRDASVACDDRRRVRERADRPDSRDGGTDAADGGAAAWRRAAGLRRCARLAGHSRRVGRSRSTRRGDAWSAETALLARQHRSGAPRRNGCGGRLDAGGGRLRRRGASCWRAA